MRILHVGPFLDWGRGPRSGGKTRSVWALIKYQVRKGHKIWHLSLSSEPELRENVPESLSGVHTVLSSGYGYSLKNFLSIDWRLILNSFTRRPISETIGIIKDAVRLRSMLEDIRPDLIHLHYSSSWFPLAFRVARGNMPLLTTCYSWHKLEHLLGEGKKAEADYERYYARDTIARSDKVVLIGDHNALVARDLGIGFPGGYDVVHVPLPDGYSGVLDRIACKAQVGLPDRKVILYCGVLKLNDRKRLDLLLKAVACSEHLRKGFTVVVIGDGASKPGLEQMAKELGVDCRFVGRVPDKAAMSVYYNAADVFGLPSEGEGWGVVYTEALYCGTPVTGYYHTMATLGKIVGDAICEPYDVARETPADLADKIIRLSQASFDRKAASDRIWQSFNDDAISEKYERIYAGMAGARGSVTR